MPKAIIVGGGIAGLASGIAFANAGWDVEVLERAARFEPLGAALSLWPNACAAMSSIGVLSAVSAVAAPITAMQLATRGGQTILRREIPDQAMMSTRASLQDALLAALSIERVLLGCKVEHISNDRITLADGATLTCDLVVDAGGIRALSSAGSPPSYAGYGGVLALSDKVGKARLHGLAAEYWGRDERFGVFELQENRRYWFYMRSQSAEASMPSLAMCQAAAEGWPEPVEQAIAATTEDALIPFAIYAKPPPKALNESGILQVGDAAHAMEPNLGQGACQGLEDAAALQAIVSTVPLEKVTAEYERMRLKRARMFVRESTQARFGAHGPRTIQTIFRAALRVIPASITERRMQGMQTMPDYLASVR
ncbi:FAD-dependent monooxygenase [Qipengyuania qiaonensis]|uniref:FAD-dependent monooxygenase n=1 Tax=Qipengyuania qiaonensis TaxID=2867240 RepID=A0ABS7J4G7_9SPHN|nr:FAD-dependent monooxygenase [Qipengyuania qiaonensis]MBX7482177.1 FAD-dependent monooxygenase [Qipengyuania qiaonensis]